MPIINSANFNMRQCLAATRPALSDRPIDLRTIGTIMDELEGKRHRTALVPVEAAGNDRS